MYPVPATVGDPSSSSVILGNHHRRRAIHRLSPVPPSRRALPHRRLRRSARFGEQFAAQPSSPGHHRSTYPSSLRRCAVHRHPHHRARSPGLPSRRAHNGRGGVSVGLADVVHACLPEVHAGRGRILPGPAPPLPPRPASGSAPAPPAAAGGWTLAAAGTTKTSICSNLGNGIQDLTKSDDSIVIGRRPRAGRWRRPPAIIQRRQRQHCRRHHCITTIANHRQSIINYHHHISHHQHVINNNTFIIWTARPTVSWVWPPRITTIRNHHRVVPKLCVPHLGHRPAKSVTCPGLTRG